MRSLSDTETVVSTGAVETDLKPRYRVGTLAYTRAGLISVFAWMLWGDFCFTLMEALPTRLFPLSLERLGAPNVLIGLLVGTAPGLLNMVFNPVISFRSDRFRSRWGRRIPFLAASTPLITLFLALIAFAPELGSWLHRAAGTPGFLSARTTTIVLLGVCVIAFQFFNLFVTSVYYYLFSDVVPQQFVGRFIALFRVVGTAAGFVFNRYIFGFTATHMREIYIGTALLFFAAFILMCWRVKEGEYPPPPTDKRPGLWGSIQTYFRECFCCRHYVWLFLGVSTSSAGTVVVGIFAVFLATKDLGLSLDDVGKLASWGLLTVMFAYLPLGYLMDKMNPLRMAIFSSVGVLAVTVAGFFFVHDYTSLLLFFLAYYVVTNAFALAQMPMYISLLPKDRFGQFASAGAMLVAIGTMSATFGAGQLLDMVGTYRIIFLWNAVFAAIATVFLVLLYISWRRLGGPTHYTPPMPNYCDSR